MRRAARDTVDELIQRVRVAFTSGRLSQALEMLAEADELELADDDRLRLARVRAVTLSRAGDNARALAAITGVASAWLDRGDPSAAASVSSMEAYIHNMLGDLDAALDAGAWTLILLDEVDLAVPSAAGPTNINAAATRNTLGLMFLDLEATDLAIGEFSLALQLAGDDDPVIAGIARANLASAFLRKALRRRSGDGRIAGADDELDGAERLARELLASEQPPRRRIEAATVLAAVLLNTDRLEEAARVLEEHRDHQPLVDDARALVDWNLLWARCHRLQGRHDEAVERVDRAMELAEQSGDRIVVSLARRERSRIREAMGDLAGALADLRTADDGARELRSGRFEALVEQLIRRAQLEAARNRWEREVEDLGVERRRLERAIETDPLTGVGNRRRLAAGLSAIVDGAPGPASVVMIDIDYFKEANDEQGHAFGDRVLVDLAAVLTSLARDGDVLCRPGGDEFVMLLPGVGPGDARSIAERIRDRVGRLRWDHQPLASAPAGDTAVTGAASVTGRGGISGTGVGVGDRRDDDAVFGLSVSIGVASGTSSDVARLVEAADAALLDAKRGGRNRIGVAADAARLPV